MGPSSSATGSSLAAFSSSRSRPAKTVGWLPELPSQAADLLCCTTALLVMVLRGPMSLHPHALTEILKLRVSLANLMVLAVWLAVWSVILRLTEPPALASAETLAQAMRLLWRALLCTLVVAAVLLVMRPGMANAGDLGVYLLVLLSLSALCRLLGLLYTAFAQPVTRRPRVVLIIGCGTRGRQAAQQLAQHPRWKYRLFGFVDPDPAMQGADVRGTLDDLETILSENPIEEVVLALPIKSRYDEIQTSIGVCERLGVQSRYSADLFETNVTKRRTFDRHDSSSVLLHMVHDTGLALKRVTDVAVSAALLLVLAPLLAAIAVAIRLTSPGPVLFRQQRYGLNRGLFTMYKFRTMVVNAEHLQGSLEHMNETGGPVFKIKQDPRITRIGGFLRKTSLDELPQLWNVLIGTMSLVGPRPLPIRDVRRFHEAGLMRRFSVAPGITGLWQVSGRSNLTFDQWIEFDLRYIDRWSFLLDLRILLRTVSVVLRREGAG